MKRDAFLRLTTFSLAAFAGGTSAAVAAVPGSLGEWAQIYGARIVTPDADPVQLTAVIRPDRLAAAFAQLEAVATGALRCRAGELTGLCGSRPFSVSISIA